MSISASCCAMLAPRQEAPGSLPVAGSTFSTIPKKSLPVPSHSGGTMIKNGFGSHSETLCLVTGSKTIVRHFVSQWPRKPLLVNFSRSERLWPVRFGEGRLGRGHGGGVDRNQ